jgi:Domain of unknown function (DUF1918)
MATRFHRGQQIRARRSGGTEALAEVLEVHAHEVYRVRWPDGLETEFVPGPDARLQKSRGDRDRTPDAPPALGG